MIGAVACLAGAAAFAWVLPTVRKHVRPIYVRLGIIPEVAAGIETATEPTVPRVR